MEGLVKVRKEILDLPEGLNIPEECGQAIFIPGYGMGFQHYYYLINLKSRRVTSWSIDLTGMRDQLKSRLSRYDSWDRFTVDQIMEMSFNPQSAEYYDGFIYVSLSGGYFMLGLGVEDDAYKVIYEPDESSVKLYSATNKVHGGFIYFSRWSVEDSYKRTKNPGMFVPLELGRYDIGKEAFEVLAVVDGPDEIHATSVADDGNTVLSLEFCQRPVSKLPEDILNAPEDVLQDILAKGLRDSHLITYDMRSKTVDIRGMQRSPAHIETDIYNDNVYYVVEHNISTTNKGLMCFGPSRINKMRTENGKSSVIGAFEGEIYRSQSLNLFEYNGKQYLVIPSHPNQAVVIDAESMQLYKRLYLTKKAKEMAVSKLPFFFPIQTTDKSPYGIVPENRTPYLYLCSIWYITLYDFELEQKIGNIIYNLNNKPLIAMGHPKRVEVNG